MKKEIFQEICSQVFSSLKNNEQLTIYLEGENSQYFRFNDSKLRQSGIIEDYAVTISLFLNKKSLQAATTVSSDIESSVNNLKNEIHALRDPLSLIPENEFTSFPDSFESVEMIQSGQLPHRNEILEALMDVITKDYLTGVWTSGKIFRACSTSEGTNHWFEKDSFIFDFSLIDEKENMVKVLFPGSSWDKNKFDAAFKEASNKLKLMNKPKMELKPGKYRVWFEPNAVADFVDESFSSKATAPFNSRGEVSKDVNIINKGELNNTLINSKTALEYGISSNFAEEANSWGMGEYMRSPFMDSGDIDKDLRLQKLGTGIFISNIHYLNWSDSLGGRITGLTRYACYWVEDGKMVAPIKTMRFDDSEKPLVQVYWLMILN